MTRVWWYPKRSWQWKPFRFLYFGGDEYCRRTVVVRTPFGNPVFALWRFRECDHHGSVS